MKQTLIISIVLFSFHLNAQVYFDHAFVEEDTLDDYTTEFVRGLAYNEFNDKYYICGSILYLDDSLNYRGDPVIYILDNYGILEQKITYALDSTLHFDAISINEESIMYTGRIDEVATEPGSDYLLAEIDFNGNLLAYNAFGSPIENEGLLSFTQSFDEGTINCGVQFTDTIGFNSAQIWINKIVDDSIYWETIIDNPNLIDVAVDIERNPIDNTYLVYTEQEEIVAGDDVQHIVILKIDEQGNIVAQSPNLKTDPNTNNTEIRDMAIDEFGNIIIVGWLGSGSFICKLDHNFNIIWDNFFQKYEDESCLAKKCLVSTDGNVVIAGSVNIPESIQVNTEYSAFIAKFDSETGDTIWYKEVVHHYPDDSIVPRQHYVEALTLAPDSGFLIGGYVIYPSNSGLPQAAWVQKLDKDGNFGITDTTTVVSLLDNFDNLLIELSPNPANNFITITSSNQNLETYRISDITGKVVQQNKFQQIINIQKLPKGVYFIGFNGNGEVYKFVKA